MSRFESWEPRDDTAARAAPPASLEIRSAVTADLDAIAAIEVQREGGSHVNRRARLERWQAAAAEGSKLLLVATVEGRVVAVAKAMRFAGTEPGVERGAPAGWYLSGVIVVPGQRRRAIGRALVQARLDWLDQRTDRVFYVANEHNRVSIALHESFGFVERIRDVVMPGVTFEGGVGLLFER